MPLAKFSTAGLLLGTLFFAFSLTPSLVPRDYLVQGVVSGVSFAVGYGGGVFVRWLWFCLELPVPCRRAERLVTAIAAVLSAITVGTFLWRAAEWQNSVRTLMGMEPVGSAQPLSVGLIALLVAGVLLGLAKLFHRTIRLLSQRLQCFVPRRVSNVIGMLAAVALFWSVIDGILFRVALRAADSSYRQIDALIEEEIAQPADRLKTGSPESLLEWRYLGRYGRQFVATGPNADQLSAFLGREAPAPLRVYVGLNSAPTPHARAQLALAELKRVGAFERSALLLITPTGTGWIDPGAVDTAEYLLGGDVASVAVQYSYLPSSLALLLEADYGAENARALFDAVHGYWSQRPVHQRPALYLHGLSLGALNSDRSFDIFDIIADPPQGALWSGPPFRSETWRSVTQRRDAGSPAWQPIFRGGSVVRFHNQHNGLARPEDGRWGPLRIVYLQYASDPVTFFEPRALYREPDWMRYPRGPDVSPALRWFPVVTMLQLAADMAAGSAPRGFGHRYAAKHYIDAWFAMMEPPHWAPEDVERLKEYFGARALSREQRARNSSPAV